MLQRSSFYSHSRTSRAYSLCFSPAVEDTDDLSDEELISLVEDTKQHVKLYKLENEIFEKTILRLDPSLMNGVQQAFEYACKLQLYPKLGIGASKSSLRLGDKGDQSSVLTTTSRVMSRSRTSRRSELYSKVSGTITGGGQKVNLLEKLELLSTEMQILVDQRAAVHLRAKKRHALLRAQLEELESRTVSIQTATKDFNKKVLEEGWDRIAQRIPAEAWISYMAEWVKICDYRILKLRLKTDTLNTRYFKIKGQLDLKLELSGNLLTVDFELTEIEIKICHETMRFKNRQSYLLKQTLGKQNLLLTTHRGSLQSQDNFEQKVKDAVVSRKLLTIKTNKLEETTKTQADELADRLDDVRRARDAYEVPDLMDYVRVKSEIADHNKKIKQMELSLQRSKRMLNMIIESKQCNVMISKQ